MSTTPTLLWIGCGSCSGESMAVLGVDGQATDFLDLLNNDGVLLAAYTALRRRLYRHGTGWHWALRHL